MDTEVLSDGRAVLDGDGFMTVEVVGAVDIKAQPALTDALTRATDSGAPAVIVDLSAVTLLSAAGFTCLWRATDLLARRAGRLHLVCPTGSPAARALQLFDPGGAWPSHSDLPTAVAMVRRAA